MPTNCLFSVTFSQSRVNFIHVYKISIIVELIQPSKQMVTTYYLSETAVYQCNKKFLLSIDFLQIQTFPFLKPPLRIIVCYQ